MNIDFLGCNGGIGSSNGELQGSTCLQVSERVLIDAGTGLERLSIAEMLAIRHVFISHSHMDHICCLPILLANIIGHNSDEPVTIYGHADTLAALQQHIFNYVIWPDFSRAAPGQQQPTMRYQVLEPLQPLELDDLLITPFATSHTIPCFGYSLKKRGMHTIFAADTTFTPALIEQLNQLEPADHLILECSFSDSYQDLAVATGHLTPALVAQVLDAMQYPPNHVWLTHLKPTYEDAIREELMAYPHWSVCADLLKY
ncbi:MAG: Ribonuclease BN [Pseudidiomarina mangrovi]|nr:MAG: Ribonuclease BN [Pseudidiomarina mangrovi]